MSLLGQPAAYDGKRVEVSGFIAPDWEGPTLFLTSEQCWRYSQTDGIALKLNESIWEDAFSTKRPTAKKLERSWCHFAEVIGTFEPVPFEEPQENVIRLGFWSGFLNEISYLSVE